MTISNPGQQMLFENFSPAHPVVVDMMAQPILAVGTLYCFMLHVVVESPDHCAWLAGNFQSKVLFETKDSDAKGETTENPLLSSSVTIQARKSSSSFLVSGNCAHQPFCLSPAIE